MSYDLMVFEPTVAPRAIDKFIEWYEQVTRWEEDHNYNDPAVCTPSLRTWFHAMRETYPAMNGPYAVSDDEIEDLKVTDYSIGTNAIYAAFSWDVSDEVGLYMLGLAEVHGLGFYDPQGELNGLFLPNKLGELVHVRPTEEPFWKRLFKSK